MQFVSYQESQGAAGKLLLLNAGDTGLKLQLMMSHGLRCA